MKYLVVILVILAGIGFFMIATTAVETEKQKPTPAKQKDAQTVIEAPKIEIVPAEKTHFEKGELDEMRGTLMKEHLKLLSEKLGVSEAAIEPAIQEEFSKWQKELFPPFAKRCLEKKLQGFDSEYTDAVRNAVDAANKKIAKSVDRTPEEIDLLRSDFVQKMYFAKEED